MIGLIFAILTIIVLIFMTVASFYQFTTKVFQTLQNIYFAMQILAQITILQNVVIKQTEPGQIRRTITIVGSSPATSNKRSNASIDEADGPLVDKYTPRDQFQATALYSPWY